MSVPVKTYKLYYFNACGLAEPIRYLLSYFGIPFQDIRLDFNEEWIPTHKQLMPMEQVPVLEIDGVRFHQHLSICRYIARTNNAWGANEEQACVMDSLVEDMNDLRLHVGTWYKENDQVRKATLFQKLQEDLLFFLKKFEARVRRNNGFFVGEKLSWVDIYYAAISESISELLQEDINKEESYPTLRQLAFRIRTHMMISPYIQKRPPSEL